MTIKSEWGNHGKGSSKKHSGYSNTWRLNEKYWAEKTRKNDQIGREKTLKVICLGKNVDQLYEIQHRKVIELRIDCKVFIMWIFWGFLLLRTVLEEHSWLKPNFSVSKMLEKNIVIKGRDNTSSNFIMKGEKWMDSHWRKRYIERDLCYDCKIMAYSIFD